MPERRRLTGPWALLTSLALHVTLVVAGAVLVARSLTAAPQVAPAPADTVEVAIIEVPGGRAHDPVGTGRSGKPDPLAPRTTSAVVGGGVTTPRPDLGRSGRGGTDEAKAAALNLADAVDGLTLSRDPMNRVDTSQAQRLATARVRRSLDDRRATPHPMQLTFLASGVGLRHERRPPARFDPELGRSRGGRPSERGGELGSDGELEEGGSIRLGATQLGAEREDAAGVQAGSAGGGYRRSAAVTLARPDVPRARAAVPAAQVGRPNDRVDSSQEVSSAVASLIHASAAGGSVGEGRGGQAGPGAPGYGGTSGPGSQSAPMGRGGLGDVGRDPQFGGYFRALLDQVEPYWREAFPSWAVAEGRGGFATVGLTVLRDGSVTGVHLIRSSGIAEFDRNLLVAIKRAAPFRPLPAELAERPLRMNLSFDATNPAVGRDGP